MLATVGEQDNLDQNRRVVSGSAFIVVPVAVVKFGEIQFMIHQVAQRMFEAARNHLLVEIHRQQFQSLVDGFESRHRAFPQQMFFLSIPDSAQKWGFSTAST